MILISLIALLIKILTPNRVTRTFSYSCVDEAMFDDYHSWIQLQKTAGGLPANIIGYLAMLLVNFLVLRGDLRNPNIILPSISIGKYLQSETIPARTQRPKMHKWPVPQRQVDCIPSPNQFTILENQLETFITKQARDGTIIRKGKAFDSLNAFFLDKHELFHIHPFDKSFHCMLHPCDAKLLVAKGWAEWFGLAGKVGQGPGTVLVYAVREKEEIDLVEKVWEAAVMFAKEKQSLDELDRQR